MAYLALLFLVLAIASFVGVVLIGKSEMYTDATTEGTCNAKNASAIALKDGDPCAIWDGKVCLKGKFSKDGGTCTKPASAWGFVLLVASGVLLIAAVLALFVK